MRVMDLELISLVRRELQVIEGVQKIDDNRFCIPINASCDYRHSLSPT